MLRFSSLASRGAWMLALAALVTTLLVPLADGQPAHADTVNDETTSAETSGTEPATTPGTGTLVYEGASLREPFSIEGDDQEPITDEANITISCVEFVCTVDVAPYWLRYAIGGTASDGELAFEWSEPESGTPCAEVEDDDYYMNATEGTAVATSTAFIAQAYEAPSEWFDCSATERSTRWGSNFTLEAPLVSGDACVLDLDACPEPAVVEVPAAPTAGETAPTTPRTPSALSSLATPAETLAPQQLISAIVLTLVLVILLALPTALLNSASSTGAEQLSRWRERLAARRAALGTSLPAGARTLGERVSSGWRRASTSGRGLPLAAGTLLAAAIISGFVDPDFGTGASTPRVLLSIAVGFTVDVLLGWVAMLILLPRLIAGVDARLDARPATLLIVLGAVVVTRLTGFEPGIVFGLVAGVAVGATLASATKVRVALLGLGWGYGLAILAWIIYAALEPAVLDASASSADGLPPLALVLLREALAAMTMAGIAALPVALVPVRGLTGHEVWQWSRRGWAALYALGLLSFFLVLMPMPFAWAGVQAALATWVAGYLVYAGVAVALWLAITKPWKKDAAPEPAALVSTTQD